MSDSTTETISAALRALLSSVLFRLVELGRYSRTRADGVRLGNQDRCGENSSNG